MECYENLLLKSFAATNSGGELKACNYSKNKTPQLFGANEKRPLARRAPLAFTLPDSYTMINQPRVFHIRAKGFKVIRIGPSVDSGMALATRILRKTQTVMQNQTGSK